MEHFSPEVWGAWAFSRALRQRVRSIGTGPRNLCPIQALPHHMHLLDLGGPRSQFRKCCLSNIDGGNKNSNSVALLSKNIKKNVQLRKSGAPQLRWRGRSRCGSQVGSRTCPAQRCEGVGKVPRCWQERTCPVEPAVWGADSRTRLHRVLVLVLWAGGSPGLPHDCLLIPLPDGSAP